MPFSYDINGFGSAHLNNSPISDPISRFFNVHLIQITDRLDHSMQKCYPKESYSIEIRLNKPTWALSMVRVCFHSTTNPAPLNNH